MPYDTLYNRMIAKMENHSNQAYADYNAYSNEMYNTVNKPFSEVFKELKLPERPFLASAKRISNHDGGITGVNGEGFMGAGSYIAKQMRHSRLGEDTRRPLFTAESESEAEESDSDQEGGGCCSGCDDDETENRVIGMAAPMKCMPVKELVQEHKGLVKVLEDKSGTHTAKMKKEAAKQKKELKSYEKTMAAKGKSGGRKPSKWIEFVKSWAVENKMSYRDALKSPKLKEDYAKHKTGGFAFLPILASMAAPLAVKGVKALVNKIRGKGENKSGGSVIGGPDNDPVNRGKITGLGKSGGRKRILKKSAKMDGGKVEPGENFYPPTGNYFEGASLGAGKKTIPLEVGVGGVPPQKKGRGKGKKTGASLFLTPSVQPTDVKATPASQDQIEKTAAITEVEGNGKRKRRTKAQMAAAKSGGMLKTLMPGSSFSGGAKKASGWIAHVKKYAADHKIKYGEALKAAAASYKK